MIYYDVTNAARSSHFSGLMRVSSCLRSALAHRVGASVVDVVWTVGGWRGAGAAAEVRFAPDDCLLTPEVFGPLERQGFSEWLAAPGCRTAAVYYDAIPLKFPAITWPRSVGRHPGYMKQLARFDRVLAISLASRDELLGFWKWAGTQARAEVPVIPLGADASGMSRAIEPPARAMKRSLLMVGIVEPRKNQVLMVDVCAILWESGLEFDLHIVGRLNPHFGKPVAQHAAAVARKHAGLRFHGALDDKTVRKLGESCRAAVFPSMAEGNGLPVLEALWQGLPCVCSRIPALQENAVGGGCVLAPVGDRKAWVETIRTILTDDALVSSLAGQAVARPLPTWDDTADAVLAAFGKVRT